MKKQKVAIKSLFEQMGFKDEDLKKPLHDAIVYWVGRNLKKLFICKTK